MDIRSPKRRKGNFIAFEGAHGSGKTTQAKLLIHNLKVLGQECTYTKEPFSEDLRDIIAHYSRKDIVQPVTLALLIAADRCLHLQYVASRLRRGILIISDRYVLSSHVYQGIQDVPSDFISEINRFAPQPDLLFIIATPLKNRLQRVTMSRKSDFFRTPKIMRIEQRLYSTLIKKSRGKPFVRVLDGTKSKEALSAKVLAETLSIL